MNSVSLLIALLVLLNVATFGTFAYDKVCAIRRVRRVPERTLFLCMGLGGSAGGWLAIFLLHHKNRKGSFLWVATLIVVAQIACLGAAYKGLQIIGVV